MKILKIICVCMCIFMGYAHVNVNGRRLVVLDLARAELPTGSYEQPDMAAGSKTQALCERV